VGFCRLRIDKNPGGGYIKELKGCGLIREVHVYGSSLCIGSNGTSSQHKGYGKKLVQVAEDIIQSHSLSKSAVIAGVGTREYYKNKCGYHLEGTYMVKNVPKLSLCYTYFICTVLVYVIIMILQRYPSVCRSNGMMELLL
jgi:elongator complex protein 3